MARHFRYKNLSSACLNEGREPVSGYLRKR